MRANLVLSAVLLLCCVQQLAAQNSTNPFELLWRKDTAATAAFIPASNKAAITAIPAPGDTVETIVSSETEEPEPPITPPAKEVPVKEEPPKSEPVKINKQDTAPVITPSLIVTEDTTTVDTTAIAEVATPPEEDKLEVSPPAEELPKEVITPKVITPVEEDQPASALVLVLLFGIVFSLLAWGLSLNRALLQKVYRAALNENLSSLLYREQRFATTQYLYYTIYIVFFLNGGMFLYFLSRQFGWTAWALQSVWYCIAVVIVIYLLRHLALSILGHTYPITKETTHFSFSILLHNILLGVALIPVNLFLAFGPDGFQKTIAIAGIVICALIYLMRQFRGLLISGSSIGMHPFHFFVYLCAIEILPLFTLVKLFHN